VSSVKLFFCGLVCISLHFYSYYSGCLRTVIVRQPSVEVPRTVVQQNLWVVRGSELMDSYVNWALLWFNKPELQILRNRVSYGVIYRVWRKCFECTVECRLYNLSSAVSPFVWKSGFTGIIWWQPYLTNCNRTGGMYGERSVVVWRERNIVMAGPGGRTVYGVGLRPLACWDYGFESHRRHGYLSWVLCVVR
jgi:hypothetical protein